MLAVLVVGVGNVGAQTVKHTRLVITMTPVGAWHALTAYRAIVTNFLELGAEEKSYAQVKRFQFDSYQYCRLFLRHTT